MLPSQQPRTWTPPSTYAEYTNHYVDREIIYNLWTHFLFLIHEHLPHALALWFG
jgi:hypothetical protein